jgi:hypothetical protein
VIARDVFHSSWSLEDDDDELEWSLIGRDRLGKRIIASESLESESLVSMLSGEGTESDDPLLELLLLLGIRVSRDKIEDSVSLAVKSTSSIIRG